MGRKYASIHVYGKDQEKVISALENNNSYDHLAEIILEKVQQKYNDDIPEKYQELLKYKDLSKILIINSDIFISIYDQTKSFETIQDKVKDFSKKINYPILYTSNFDDGVFLIGAYKAGKLITNGRMGPELSAYDLKLKYINIDKLCDSVQLAKTETLEAIKSMEEIDEIEQVVEEYLHIPLYLDFDSVESNAAYVETLSNNRYRVFNKV